MDGRLRLAKFNARSVTVTRGGIAAKRDGEPLQCCLVFMLSGWKHGGGVIECSRPVVATQEAFQAFYTCLFSLVGLCGGGWVLFRGQKHTNIEAHFNHDIKGPPPSASASPTQIQISRSPVVRQQQV